MLLFFKERLDVEAERKQAVELSSIKFGFYFSFSSDNVSELFLFEEIY